MKIIHPIIIISAIVSFLGSSIIMIIEITRKKRKQISQTEEKMNNITIIISIIGTILGSVIIMLYSFLWLLNIIASEFSKSEMQYFPP